MPSQTATPWRKGLERAPQKSSRGCRWRTGSAILLAEKWLAERVENRRDKEKGRPEDAPLNRHGERWGGPEAARSSYRSTSRFSHEEISHRLVDDRLSVVLVPSRTAYIRRVRGAFKKLSRFDAFRHEPPSFAAIIGYPGQDPAMRDDAPRLLASVSRQPWRSLPSTCCEHRTDDRFSRPSMPLAGTPGLHPPSPSHSVNRSPRPPSAK